jgi:hypothetical protein
MGLDSDWDLLEENKLYSICLNPHSTIRYHVETRRVGSSSINQITEEMKRQRINITW